MDLCQLHRFGGAIADKIQSDIRAQVYKPIE